MIHDVLFDQEQDPIFYVLDIWLTEYLFEKTYFKGLFYGSILQL